MNFEGRAVACLCPDTLDGADWHTRGLASELQLGPGLRAERALCSAIACKRTAHPVPSPK